MVDRKKKERKKLESQIKSRQAKNKRSFSLGHNPPDKSSSTIRKKGVGVVRADVVHNPENVAKGARAEFERRNPPQEVELRKVGSNREVEEVGGIKPEDSKLPPEEEDVGFLGEPSAVLPGRTRGETLGLAAGIGATAFLGGAAILAIRGATIAGSTLLATGGLSSPAVSAAAAGRLVSSRVIKTTALGGGKKLVSVYAAKKQLSLMNKIIKGGKYVAATFGILSGFAFAGQFLVTQTFNDSADAIDGYKFGIAAADRAGDTQAVEELGDAMDEAYAGFKATEGTDYINYPKAAVLKIEAAKKVADSVRKRTENLE